MHSLGAKVFISVDEAAKQKLQRNKKRERLEEGYMSPLSPPIGPWSWYSSYTYTSNPYR